MKEDDLLDYIPKYDYIYHNLRDLSEEAIRLLDNQFLVSFLLTLKYAFDKEMLKVKLPEILMLMFAGGSGDSQHTLVVYNFELVDYSVEEIKQILDGLPSNLQDKVMNTYQMLIEKGRQEEREIAARLIARERAKAERQAYAEKLTAAGKLKASGLENEMIADIMALPLNVVESL